MNISDVTVEGEDLSVLSVYGDAISVRSTRPRGTLLWVRGEVPSGKVAKALVFAGFVQSSGTAEARQG